MQLINEALEANLTRFIQSGTLQLVQRLKQAVLRRMLKKVVLLTCYGGNRVDLCEPPTPHNPPPPPGPLFKPASIAVISIASVV